MGKSKILKELANNEISLDVAINRLLIISSDLENIDLYSWCLNELNGYDSKESVPDYRTIINTNITYTGFNGRFQVNKQPLPLTLLPLDDLKDLAKFKFMNGINTLVNLSNSDMEVSHDLTRYAGHVLKNSGIQCISIQQTYSNNDFSMIIEKIKTLLLTIFIKLDKELGNIDSLDIDIETIPHERLEKINSEIHKYINYNNYEEVI